MYIHIHINIYIYKYVKKKSSHFKPMGINVAILSLVYALQVLSRCMFSSLTVIETSFGSNRLARL